MRKSAAYSFFLALHSLLGPGHGVTAASQETATRRYSSASPDACAYEPAAKVSDACASFADLDTLNTRLSPFVRQLVSKADFFSYYRLNLYNKVCPFWSDENGMCGNVACAVTTLESEDQIPPTWRAEELSRLEGPKAHHPDKLVQRERPQKPLQGELGADVGESCVVEYDDECDERDYCVPEDESSSGKGDYVSLVDNPERFTGYAGEGARQVWEVIYRENCFSRPVANSQTGGSSNKRAAYNPFGQMSAANPQASMDLRAVLQEHGRQQAMQTGSVEDTMEFDDECVEKRIFYRIISGMHASISIHLCHDFLNQTTGAWGPNLQCYQERIHKHPERISNLYFNYALVVRAVGKLKDYVQDYTFCTGDEIEDAMTKRLITALANALPAGPEIFDERVMFQDKTALGERAGITLKEDFRNRFRNVSRIMDCVGCDKCRLWGKLQTAGYGTALKVLFEFGHDDEISKPKLRRTELIALINTLDKISQALAIIGKFKEMMDRQQVSVDASAQRPRGSPVDDEHGKVINDTCETAKTQDQSIGEIFWEEWARVQDAWVYVLASWIGLPHTIWTFVLVELDRMWSYWLGLPVRPRGWSLQWNKDEL